ncbi:MAG TPA: lysylphosphatidylglycerol synthase transmembrane domain-containing protein [Gemmatimonadaceae bacterium]
MKLEWTPGRRRAALAAAWILATALLAICTRSIEWGRASDVLATARPAWIVIAIVANAAILPLMATFWMVLRPTGEAPVSFRRVFEIASTATALMNTVPFGAGHASMVVLLSRRGNTTTRGALSVLALDQLGEGLAKVALFVLVALLAPIPSWMRAGIATATALVAVLFVVLVAASRWANELAILKNVERSSSALACVAGTKVAEAMAIVAVQNAFGLEVTASGTLLVLAAAILGSMIPVTPGNVGTYEAGVFVAYRHLGMTPEQALSLALVQHMCFIVPSVGAGYLVLSAQTLSRSAIASR